MCGIAGILDISRGRSLRDLISQMNDKQRHRGQDDGGTYFDDGLVIGHNRLSIIDTSPVGHQPMEINNGELVIVFNGEIYNYVELKEQLVSLGAGPFKSKTDTEVLLWSYKIWGKQCLSKLNGMFAFAIWDKNKRELFCARDRIGIKPFYYYLDETVFAFSSEIKALFLDGLTNATPNDDVIRKYLMQGSYGLPDETFFKDIRVLSPGHYMTIDDGLNLISSSYWRLDYGSDKIDNEKEAMNEYLSLMSDSIRLRLRSDVPIGLDISSGLDSSILMGVIDYYLGYKSKFHVYTYTCNDQIYDECCFVEELLKNRNHIWHKYSFDKSQFYDSLVEMQYFLDEPFGGLPTLAESQIYKRGRHNGTIVFLSGEGMDEQWAGYDYYLDILNKNDLDDISVVQGTKNPLMQECINKDFISNYIPVTYPLNFKSPVDNLRFRDIFYTKIPRSLRTNDRISMAYGTELRVPFLDYRMVEYAFKIPLKFLIKDGVQKYLLRKMSFEMLPMETVNRSKRKLQTPQREWLKELAWVKDILYSDKFKSRNIFDTKKTQKLYNEYVRGEYDNSFFLWQWINLEVWFRTFID
jgi:asparagine synthase (glutamine-hydrolysing)